MSTSWGPQTGGSPSRLRRDNLPRTRPLGGSTAWDPRLELGVPQDPQRDYYWVVLRDCNLNSLAFCPLLMGIDMMQSNPSLCPETGNLVKQQ